MAGNYHTNSYNPRGLVTVGIKLRWDARPLASNYHIMVVFSERIRTGGLLMAQKFKNVYFADCPQSKSCRASLTLAFGKDDEEIHNMVRHVSSDTLRQALGYQSFLSLQEDAKSNEKTVNAYCLSILRSKIKNDGQSKGAYLPGFEPTDTILIDPIQATFTGGRHEPLHDWYPYLEGYSPAFVETVMGRYCPEAKSVFDPFSGSGTTPLTASRLGKIAYYAEINPLLQFVTDTKIVALRLGDQERVHVVAVLRNLAATFKSRLKRLKKDAHLQQSYFAVFGGSEFFDHNVFSDVLRSRTLVDEIGCRDPHAARFLTTAIVKSLLPASRLIRRGDVRFKIEKELSRERIALGDAVCEALSDIAADIESLYPIDKVPLLILENAKNLAKLPRIGVDAVITSPPYLNGTNYFRNTKVELWFLRCLKRSGDLSHFRFNSMTVGINDVTVRKPIREMPASARRASEELGEKAYDPRIPRMIGCYASEMQAVLKSLVRHAGKKSRIIIDIGDSAYAGVHVPTDRFMIEALEPSGFEIIDEILLRQRRSRSQMPLRQKLLVFERKNGRKASTPVQKNKNPWRDKWRVFRETLPHQQGAFAKRNWGHPLHSLCSYQGKMKPSLAAHLVKAFTNPGARLLDPFCGVGTIPFEAALYGVESWGFDINPPAVHITAAKIGQCSLEECDKVLKRIKAYLKKASVRESDRAAVGAIRFNGPLISYFHERTFREVLLARRYFLNNPPESATESLVFACLLHVLHGNRPYALSRRSHPLTPFAPTGPTEYRPLMPRLKDKIDRSFATAIPEGFRQGQALFQDATEWWPAHVEDLDAIITSPPFFDSTRFYLANWMRLWFSGWESDDFQQRPMAFIDERQKRGFEVYHPIFRQCRERLKPGGVAVFHLGVSRKCDMAEAMANVAKTWFRIADVFTESVSHCERHGIRDKGTVVSHQYLVME